jgi:hypothetical protein
MKSNTNPKVPYQMERVRALIIKLQEQADQGAEPSVLLVTAQLLQAALQEQASAASVHRNGNSKVAVVLPVVNQTIQKISPEPKPALPEIVVEYPQKAQEPETALPSDWLHSLMQEIPTLAHQKDIRELNDVMSQQMNGASLNDKLKQGSVELADVLTREPVRDLKKAIGINDRFVFVQELFRGDEVMYERSIKTINSFNILQEAEYWIERELKLKLAWDDSKDTVRHFCQLVSRRFSSK